jgi:hypothetical protein
MRVIGRSAYKIISESENNEILTIHLTLQSFSELATKGHLERSS